MPSQPQPVTAHDPLEIPEKQSERVHTGNGAIREVVLDTVAADPAVPAWRHLLTILDSSSLPILVDGIIFWHLREATAEDLRLPLLLYTTQDYTSAPQQHSAIKQRNNICPQEPATNTLHHSSTTNRRIPQRACNQRLSHTTAAPATGALHNKQHLKAPRT
ncbi:g9312 [Coccomyxa elongata]